MRSVSIFKRTVPLFADRQNSVINERLWCIDSGSLVFHIDKHPPGVEIAYFNPPKARLGPEVEDKFL